MIKTVKIFWESNLDVLQFSCSFAYQGVDILQIVHRSIRKDITRVDHIERKD